MKRRWKILIILIMILGSALCVVTMFVGYTDRGYICENTGSRKGYREWFFGAKTNEWYYESELERFLETHHPEAFRRRWTSFLGTGHSLIMTSRGHGSPGAILMLDRKMFDDHVHGLSNTQRLKLYQFFCCDDQDDIRRTVEMIHGSEPRAANQKNQIERYSELKNHPKQE